jgi:hypothetical protein
MINFPSASFTGLAIILPSEFLSAMPTISASFVIDIVQLFIRVSHGVLSIITFDSFESLNVLKCARNKADRKKGDVAEGISSVAWVPNPTPPATNASHTLEVFL